jgi:hypothetical protein
MNGYFHALPTLYLGKNDKQPLDMRRVGFRSSSECEKEQKNPMPISTKLSEILVYLCDNINQY